MSKSFATVAPIYDEYRHEYSTAAIEHIKSLAGLTTASKVLDLACGTGLVLREFLDTGEIYGLDMSWDMLVQAQRRYSKRRRVYLTQGNGEALPFLSQVFELVTIGQAIHWFKLEKLVPELQRILKPNAWVAVISKYPSPREPYRRLYEYVLDKVNSRMESRHYKLTSVNGVGNILGMERAGFSNYERVVFENTVEHSVETYLNGCATDPAIQALGEHERTLFLKEMERALNKLARDGIFQEGLLEYVITMKYAPA